MSEFESILRRFEPGKHERLEKDSETYKIVSRVFDRSTLLTLYHMINRGLIEVFRGIVSAGKEANIFCALDREGDHVAVKIYRIATSDFKNMHRYLMGDPRFSQVRGDRRKVVYAWAMREFKNLQRACEAGVAAPRPLGCERNVLVMEFIGEGGVPYPRMKDSPPESPKRTFKELLGHVRSLYRKAELIHTDLSEYNVLLNPDPVLIDFSLATDIRDPNGDEFLMRDLSNLVGYFRRLGLKLPEPSELFEDLKGGWDGGR